MSHSSYFDVTGTAAVIVDVAAAAVVVAGAAAAEVVIDVVAIAVDVADVIVTAVNVDVIAVGLVPAAIATSRRLNEHDDLAYLGRFACLVVGLSQLRSASCCCSYFILILGYFQLQ